MLQPRRHHHSAAPGREEYAWRSKLRQSVSHIEEISILLALAQEEAEQKGRPEPALHQQAK